MTLNLANLDYVRSLVREQSAIVLEREKAYLVEARLRPLAKREGLESIDQLVVSLQANPHGGLKRKIVEAMTTNETSWFRDQHPFTALREVVVPRLMRRQHARRTLNIWCAASSSGQEPYSILMLLKDHFPELDDWKVQLVATDISHAMVERTRLGSYNQLEVNRGLPALNLVKYFQRDGASWQVRDELRRMIDVRTMNLAGLWPTLPPMDIVFIRNVLIYFDKETKRKILQKIERVMQPDGFLFLGGAETTYNLNSRFVRCEDMGTNCYRLEHAAKS